MKRFSWLLAVVFAVSSVVMAGSIQANSLWEDNTQSSFSDHKAVSEGDIIQIVISEQTNSSSDAEREREKDMEVGGESGVDAPNSSIFNEFADLIPLFGASASGGSSYESERETGASASLTTELSARVDEVTEHGNLRLEGSRKIKIEDDIKNIHFSGLARQEDVSSNNTIPSNRVANAEIRYEGELGVRSGWGDSYLGQAWSFIKNVLWW